MGGLAFLYPDAYNGWLEEGYKTAFASYEEMLTFLDRCQLMPVFRMWENSPM